MNFTEFSILRPDLAFIAHWINVGSQVLDVGCGDGVMLDYLQTDKKYICYGIKINDTRIPECIIRNFSVIQQNIEDGLAIFEENSFDVVLCLSALKMVKDVAMKLHESSTK